MWREARETAELWSPGGRRDGKERRAWLGSRVCGVCCVEKRVALQQKTCCRMMRENE